MFNIKTISLFLLLVCGYCTSLAFAQHPLDGLSKAEFAVIANVLMRSDKIETDARFAMVNLAEPAKQFVMAWQPGDPLRRQALVIVRQERQVYEAIVDIDARAITSWRHIENAQPALLDEEWLTAQKAVRADAGWREAVAARGIKNYKQVFCFPTFAGYFDTERDKQNRRLGMVGCYDANSKNGLWGRPVPGLMAVVDYDTGKVIELSDTGVVPVPEGGPQIDKHQPQDLQVAGPEKRRFTIHNNWVEWDKWRFHLRIDPRVGPVLSQVSIHDGARRRSVLYQGAVSELFVPYMDPTRNWYFRTYLDVGEYNIGTSGVPLQKGVDCPGDSSMIDAAFMNERGKSYTKQNIACVFERETGNVAWSHYEMPGKASVNRRYTELVVRFVVWLGNYDYVVDWIFNEEGALKGRVGATGIVQVRGVASESLASATAATDTAFGRLIAPGTIAVNHDHFFNFRLDVDVDGSRNQMNIDRLRRVDLTEADYGTPRRQIWQIDPQIAKREADAQLNVNPQAPALWRVSNPAITNRTGNPVSYQLQPGVTGRTLLNDAEIAHRRAGFSAYNLWVTPYNVAERHAAGDYPNQHPGGAGLPDWTRSNRNIENTDVVLWYTIGMHHVVRAEDWPIMPTVYSEFELRPFDFFNHNPTIAAPQQDH